jgi:hypothetical protein
VRKVNKVELIIMNQSHNTTTTAREGNMVSVCVGTIIGYELWERRNRKDVN